ncbi:MULTISPECIES: peptidoglycan DD-metalloendopeptidase family protein [unclassified Cupriavidus]|uniref:peptidoglycan DD-metalloendopeptidase family protein n=1 Tax=unclassified Cupriavidus TaxID=2640874 RepID=UPI00040A4315|nr:MULTISPECIES: peptidoglycan DD-metalloendopeptidase family protein [unclassified Cupriavidus]MBP0628578.1 peptidoglycan DD-metalloendopeptidase family protein [Cupriavidus sp. AcVe19-1a]MBP0636359.1 peptidoglycan DD-metalloendopeptidase family protein [Cupriavidus sp. AcVe19-6a]
MTKTRHDIEPGRRRALGLLIAATAAAVASGCGTTGGPVPDGYYRVERGDTLYSIARKHGRTVRDLTRWNSDITSPSQIEVGQLIRVRPAGGAGATASTGTGQAVTDTPRVDSGSSRPPAGGIRLQWPADGRVTAGYSPPGSKGLTIAVPANGTVRAAAAGRAIHVGNLRGYGMLVIVKHNDDWLTVYGNLDQPLVSEGATISAGQDVGRMGASASELHFEVRGNGKPVDPMAYLPSRG